MNRILRNKIAILQIYINLTKGVTVDINYPENDREYDLLNYMYTIAIKKMNSWKVKLIDVNHGKRKNKRNWRRYN